MANKRDESKQRRARENRAQREAREARAKAAAVPFEERVAAKAPERGASAGVDAAKRGGKSTKGAKGSGASRRPPVDRPGMTPVDLETLEGSWFSKMQRVPGGQQIVMTVLMTLALSVMASFSKLFAADGAKKGAKPTLTIFDSLGARAWIYLAVPIAISLIAAWSTLKPFRRRVWRFCFTGMAVFMLASPIGIFYLFPAGTIGWAMWRAARVEGPQNPRRARGSAGDDAGSASAIEADVTSADD